MRSVFKMCLVLTLSVGLGQVVSAQDYTLTADAPESVSNGAVFEVPFLLTNDGDDIQGYQWGVCQDTDFLSIDEDPVDGVDAVDIDYTFEAVAVQDSDGDDLNDGWTVGALLNVITGAVIAPADEDYEMYIGTYTALDLTDETVLEWCETLGTPAVTVRVIVDGDEIEPELVDGIVGIVEGDPPFEYLYASEEVFYDPATGIADATVTLSILEDEENPAAAEYPADTAGFECAIGHDDTVMEIVEAVTVGELADLNDGEGPGFFGPNLSPDGGAGVTIGVVYSLTSGAFIQFDEEKAVIDLNYEAVADALIDQEENVETDVTHLDELGDPPVTNAVVVDGANFGTVGEGVTVTFIPDPRPPFIRGDANDDFRVNVADGVYILNALFQDGPGIGCEAAANLNGDSRVDASDATFIFMYRFLDGEAPAAPFPDCGPSDEDEECETQVSCD